MIEFNQKNIVKYHHRSEFYGWHNDYHQLHHHHHDSPHIEHRPHYWLPFHPQMLARPWYPIGTSGRTVPKATNSTTIEKTKVNRVKVEFLKSIIADFFRITRNLG